MSDFVTHTIKVKQKALPNNGKGSDKTSNLNQNYVRKISREITNFCISDVPSPIVHSLLSR